MIRSYSLAVLITLLLSSFPHTAAPGEQPTLQAVQKQMTNQKMGSQPLASQRIKVNGTIV